jgi:hypothetical protein
MVEIQSVKLLIVLSLVGIYPSTEELKAARLHPDTKMPVGFRPHTRPSGKEGGCPKADTSVMFLNHVGHTVMNG